MSGRALVNVLPLAICSWAIVIAVAGYVKHSDAAQLVLGGVLCLLGLRLWWVQWREP